VLKARIVSPVEKAVARERLGPVKGASLEMATLKKFRPSLLTQPILRGYNLYVVAKKDLL
jgi:hypothetical protein